MNILENLFTFIYPVCSSTINEANTLTMGILSRRSVTSKSSSIPEREIVTFTEEFFGPRNFCNTSFWVILYADSLLIMRNLGDVTINSTQTYIKFVCSTTPMFKIPPKPNGTNGEGKPI